MKCLRCDSFRCPCTPAEREAFAARQVELLPPPEHPGLLEPLEMPRPQPALKAIRWDDDEHASVHSTWFGRWLAPDSQAEGSCGHEHESTQAAKACAYRSWQAAMALAEGPGSRREPRRATHCG